MSTLLVVYSALLSPSLMVLLKSSVFSFSFAFINEFMPVFAFGFVLLLIEFHSRICIYLFVLACIFCNFFSGNLSSSGRDFIPCKHKHFFSQNLSNKTIPDSLKLKIHFYPFWALFELLLDKHSC